MNTGGRERAERRLAAILAADVAGYSRLMGEDEEGTLVHVNSLTESPGATRAQGVDYARQALHAANGDPLVLASAAFVFGHFGEDIDAAMALMDRALVANPGFALGWQLSGVLRLYAGQPDTAIEHVERSLRLNPRDRVVAPLTAIGGAYIFKRGFDTAVAKLQASPRLRDVLPYARCILCTYGPARGGTRSRRATSPTDSGHRSACNSNPQPRTPRAFLFRPAAGGG